MDVHLMAWEPNWMALRLERELWWRHRQSSWFLEESQCWARRQRNAGHIPKERPYRGSGNANNVDSRKTGHFCVFVGC